jgi:hypothetical protein
MTSDGIASQRVYIIGLGVFLLLLSCASQRMVEKALQPKFNGMVLAKDVDSSGTVGVPVELTSDFSKNDEQAVAFISFDDVTGSHSLRWEWIAPGGEIYLVSNDYAIVVNNGKYLPKVTAWHRLYIKSEPAADTLGEWNVAIYVDNELADVKPFRLIE